MSTTATTPERSHAPYAEPDEYIDYQLRKTQAGIKRTDMLTAAVVSATMLIGYVLLFVISDHWLFDGGMSGTMRLLMWLPVVGAVGWMIGTKMIWPALRTVSGLFAAKTLEASAPEFRSSLLSLIDLKRSNRTVAPIIMATMEKRAAVTFTKFNVDDAIDKRLLLRTLYVLFGIVVAFCLYSVLSPKNLGPSVLRAILPFSNVRPATQTEILEVKPGHTKLRAGGSLAIEVQLRGATPPDVRLFFTTADRRFKNEPVELGPTTDTQRYLGTLGQDEQGLLQSFSYFVVAGDARSPDYNVEIITPPSATVTDVRCEFPAYTELDPTTQMGGAIDVWERTAVTITAATNMPVARTESELSDTQDFATAASYPGPSPKLDDGGKRLTISWRADPRQAGVVLPGQSNSPFPKFYRVKVWDAEGHPDPKPAVYPINVRIDQPPQVVLLDPKTNLEMPVNGIVPLAIAARDPDFKLRTVSLKIARDGNDVTDETLFDGAQQEVSLRHDFVLEPLRLKPGDKVRFWIEAQDNRLPVHGLAKTAPLEITITGRVTKDEVKKQLAEQKQEQKQRIDEAFKNNDEGTERTDQQPSDPRDPPEQQARDANEPEQRPRPKSDDPNEERPNPDQKDQQPGDDKKAEGQTGSSGKPSDKQQPGGKAEKPQPGGTSKSADPKSNDKSDPAATQKPPLTRSASEGEREQSLKNDGTDDDRALQKIADREQRRGRWPKNKPQDSSTNNPPQNSDNNPSDKPMPDESDNANKPSSPDKPSNPQDKPNKPNKQRGQPGEKTEQPNSPQADGDPADKPNPDSDPKAKPNESNDDKKPTKPGTQKSQPDKSPKNSDPDKSQSPTADDPKPSDSADKPDSDSGDKPKDKSKDQDKKRPGGNAPKAANDADKPNDPSDKKPMPGEGDDKQQPGSPKKDKSDKPNSDPKDEGSDKKKPGAGSDNEKPTPPNDDKKPSGKQPPSDNADDMNSTDKADKPNNQKPKPKSADKNAAPDKESPDDKADSPKKPSQAKKPDDKPNDSSDKPGQESPDDKPQSDKKPSDKKQPSPDGEKSPDGKPSADEGKGPKGKDEKSKSDKPGDSDKPGKPDEAGKSPSDKPGDGDSEGESKDGKPSGKPKPGKGSPSSNKTDGPLGKGSGGTGGGAVPGDAEQSDGRGQPGDKDAKPTRKQSDQSGSGAGSSEDESPNEQFTKEAANLVLKRLQGELKRGEVDQELLDELGWTPEQMKKFLERMEPNFEAKPEDNSPAAKARRRQFEEMLRNLDLTSKAQRRDDTNKDKQSGDGVGSVRRPPPPHLREWWESYTKGLSKKQAAEQPKK